MDLGLFDFDVFPSVLPADSVSRVVIRPRGENVDFTPGHEYRVTVSPVETLCSSYGKLPRAEYTLMPEQDGTLILEHFFGGEQTHIIKVEIPPEFCYSPAPNLSYLKKQPSLYAPTVSVRSVFPDLLGRRAYKGDLHLHTCFSDGREDVCGVVTNLRRAGFDFVAVTDHFYDAPSRRVIARYENGPDLMTLLPGEEVHVPVDRIHAVCVGASVGINDYYRADKAAHDAEIAQIARELAPNLPSDIDAEDFAARIWIARTSKHFGGMPIFVHPHWFWNDVYFVAERITEEIFASGEYEAYELLNSCSPVTCNTQATMYYEQFAAGHEMPVVGSSDSHNTCAAADASLPTPSYTVVFAPDRSYGQLHQSVLDGYSTAVSQFGDLSSRTVYGRHRVVKHAIFLLENYFPRYAELCAAEALPMREYGMSPSEETAELLRTLSRRREAFAEGFFGLSQTK